MFNISRDEVSETYEGKYAELKELTAEAVHEINTPIGIGITAISFLQNKTNELRNSYISGMMKKSDFEKYMEISSETIDEIYINLERTAKLIKEFKQLSEGNLQEEMKEFNIKRCIEDTILGIGPEIKKTKHKIHVSCSEDIILFSYPGAFSQILTNFMMNSFIHGFEEKEEGNITINIKRNKKDICIQYSDDGKGIEDKNLDKIFQPFFTTKRGKGGTGLGLYMVYNIVTQKLGGTITCESHYGYGIKFTLNIPICT